jgi:hypothetical protein
MIGSYIDIHLCNSLNTASNLNLCLHISLLDIDMLSLEGIRSSLDKKFYMIY